MVGRHCALTGFALEAYGATAEDLAAEGLDARGNSESGEV